MRNAAKLGFLPGKLGRGVFVLMMVSLISNLAFLPDKPTRGGSPIGPYPSLNSWSKKLFCAK